MAITIGTIGKYGQTSGSYPWTITTASTIDTTGAEALLVIILNSSASKGTPTVKFGGSDGKAMTLLGSQSNGSNGKLFLFGLLAPAQTTTGSLYVNNPSENGDNTTIMVLPLSGVALTNPWGAISYANGVNGAAISFTNTTTAAGSTVLGIHTSVYGPGVGGMSESGGTPSITAVDSAAVDSSCAIKVFRQEVTASGGTAVGSGTINYSDHMIYQLEVKGSSGPPKQTLKAPSISNTSSMGGVIVKDPKVTVLGPTGINASAGIGFGTITVTRASVAYYDRNGTGHTVTGTPATIVERTSVASNYRVSTAAVPVVSGEKKYWEITVGNVAATSIPAVGVGVISTPLDAQLGGYLSDAVSWDASGGARDNNTGLNGKVTYTTGDIIMIAVDMVNGWIFMGKNGTWYNGSTAGNVNFTSGDGKVNNTNRSPSVNLYPAVQTQNIGDKLTTNFGRAAFAYTPPTGFTGLDAGGPGAKTLTVPSISNTSNFGTHSIAKLSVILKPAGIAPTAAVGGVSVIQLSSVSGLANVSVLGKHNVVQKITMAGLLNTSSLGSPTVAQIVKPAGIDSTETLGSVSVVQRFNPSSIDTTAAVGAPVVNAKYGFSVPGINGTMALGTPTVRQLLNPTGLDAAIGAMGTPSVAQIIGVASYVNTSLLGSHTLNQKIKAPGIDNVKTLGDPIVSVKKVQLALKGILDQGTLGTPTVNQKINISGINNVNALGNPFVTNIYKDASVHPSSITNISKFGDHQVNSQIVVPGILADQAAFGSHLVVGVPKLIMGSIVNTSKFGTQKIKLFVQPAGINNISQTGAVAAVQKVQVAALGNVEALGTPSIYASIELYPSGIIPTAVLGSPEVCYALIEVDAPGIPDTSVLGSPSVSQIEYVPSILNASALGSHRINFGVLMALSIINDNYLGNHKLKFLVGDTTKFTRVDGKWLPVETLLVKHGNVWLEVDTILEKQGGVWVQIY